jgi:predicted metalloprotease with PDZ domain
MITYLMQQKNPASHYIYIDLLIDNVNSNTLKLQLPSWRPGRYELGNFAKNIKRVDAFNENNEAIGFTKTNKDNWIIDSKGCSSVKITYSYYAAELNAGACYADTQQIYVNPVHCCMSVEGRTEELHQVKLQVPETYKIATSLVTDGNTLTASNYEELVDSPFIASASIKTDYYEINNIKFFLHFVGQCNPDFEKLKTDFSAFTRKQLEFWGGWPTSDYHFLFQILPVKFYHGVEHQKNTVIAIGPGYALHQGKTYEDVLGVSCHELFHTWNIKYIRPIEMLPYNYTKENYAKTGYVYEGFTTYYGDKLLLSSSVFDMKQYLETLEERLHKHFHNFGRYNLSVSDSSWETWLDGYVPGAPYRKTNIYDEGCLIALILDAKILESTNNKKSLRDVCVLLFERFGKQNKGYTEKDIVELVNEVSGKNLSAIFENYVYKANDFEVPLKEAFDYLGITFIKEKNNTCSEHYFGFKTTDNGSFARITMVAPYSPGWKAGLFNGDEIIAVNEMIVKNNLNQWLLYFLHEETITLTVNSGEKLKTLLLQKDKKGNSFFFTSKLNIDRENDAFTYWKTM